MIFNLFKFNLNITKNLYYYWCKFFNKDIGYVPISYSNFCYNERLKKVIEDDENYNSYNMRYLNIFNYDRKTERFLNENKMTDEEFKMIQKIELQLLEKKFGYKRIPMELKEIMDMYAKNKEKNQ